MLCLFSHSFNYMPLEGATIAQQLRASLIFIFYIHLPNEKILKKKKKVNQLAKAHSFIPVQHTAEEAVSLWKCSVQLFSYSKHTSISPLPDHWPFWRHRASAQQRHDKVNWQRLCNKSGYKRASWQAKSFRPNNRKGLACFSLKDCVQRSSTNPTFLFLFVFFNLRLQRIGISPSTVNDDSDKAYWKYTEWSLHQTQGTRLAVQDHLPDVFFSATETRCCLFQ